MADVYTIALRLLAARDLSEAQLRVRLVRRECVAQEVESTIEKLKRDGALDDARVARAVARFEAAVRQRGRGRALQRIRSLGIDASLAAEAVDEVFGELNETALLDRALERRLKGTAPASLDRAAIARIVRGLLGQGFQAAAIFRRLRAHGGPTVDEA
ncbi:MAG: regulatory protein RecX [Vicinamibacterales bacterium]